MVNYLIVMFAVSLIYLSIAERFRIYAGLMGLQGVLLFGITLLELKEVNTANLVFIASETLLFKAIVVPLPVIQDYQEDRCLSRCISSLCPGFYLLILNIAALILSIILANALMNPYINTVYMTIALFCFFTGMLAHRYT